MNEGSEFSKAESEDVWKDWKEIYADSEYS
jgi:hypothetical protein